MRSIDALVRVALVFVFLLLQGMAVQAKLVAVVFDTSGSMQPHYRLPAFGMRLLAATMDGRAGFDRLWTLNFKAYDVECVGTLPEVGSALALPCLSRDPVQEFDLTSGPRQQAAADRLQDEFTNGDSGTPYGPLEVMLDRIAANAADGEEVVLVVVTDGAYHQNQDGSTEFDKGVSASRFRKAFQVYRKRMLDRKITLSAQFLFIDSDGTAANIVNDQGVRDGLLEVFNGNPTIGAWHVTGEANLWEALVDIVARVSGTDRGAQAPFVHYADNSITVDTPLSISRVVVVETGPLAAALPALTSKDFGGVAWTEARDIGVEMAAADVAFPGTVLHGVARQLSFQNPVPPGTHVLSFDKKVSEGVFLLFKTSAITRLSLFTEEGSPILPNAQGVLEVTKGASYQFRAEILDGGGSAAPVAFSALPDDLAIYLDLDGAQKVTTDSMTLDGGANLGSFGWTPQAEGTFQATGRAVTGILSPTSTPLQIEVVDARAEIAISLMVAEETCTDCSPDQVRASVGAGVSGLRRVGSQTITASSTRPGAVDLSASQIPEGYELRRKDGSPVDPYVPLSMQPNESLDLELWRPASLSAEQIAEGSNSFVLVAKPAGGWSGETAEANVKILLVAPDMKMSLVSVTRSLTQGQVDGLEVPDSELRRGQFVAQFSLQDLVAAPDPARVDQDVVVTTDPLTAALVTMEPSLPDPGKTGFNALDIRPKSNIFCFCLLGGANFLSGSDQRDVAVRYQVQSGGVVLQSAGSMLRVALPISIGPVMFSCGLNALAVLVAWMLVRAFISCFRTQRFPKGSVVEISDGNSVPRFKRLDRGNTWYWKVLFAFIFGDPHESRFVEGLKITATSRGASVDVKSVTPPWRVERLGESFGELKANNARKTQYDLFWGDRLEHDIQLGLTMRLKKKSSDA